MLPLLHEIRWFIDDMLKFWKRNGPIIIQIGFTQNILENKKLNEISIRAAIEIFFEPNRTCINCFMSLSGRWFCSPINRSTTWRKSFSPSISSPSKSANNTYLLEMLDAKHYGNGWCSYQIYGMRARIWLLSVHHHWTPTSYRENPQKCNHRRCSNWTPYRCDHRTDSLSIRDTAAPSTSAIWHFCYGQPFRGPAAWTSDEHWTKWKKKSLAFTVHNSGLRSNELTIKFLFW